MADKTSGKRKRSKGFFLGQKKKKRGIELLSPGMKGVLITCNEREKQCVREAYNLLNEYADKLYGPEVGNEEDERSSGSEEDVEDALAKEVKELKDTQQDKRFQSVLSGANNVIFIKTSLPDSKDPTELVHHILMDMVTTGSRKTRHCQRFLPIGGSCRANIQDIKNLGQEIFKSSFFADDVGPLKFLVMYKARNNGDIHRDDVIAAVAGDVMGAGKGHSVNLKNPDLAICVEIIKNVCCMSVVKDVFKLRKYNIRELNEQIHTHSKTHQAPDSNDNSNKEENSCDQEVDAGIGQENNKIITRPSSEGKEHQDDAEAFGSKEDKTTKDQRLCSTDSVLCTNGSVNDEVKEEKIQAEISSE